MRCDNRDFNGGGFFWIDQWRAVVSDGERGRVDVETTAGGAEVVGRMRVHLERDVLPVAGGCVEGLEDVVQGGEARAVAGERSAAFQHDPIAG